MDRLGRLGRLGRIPFVDSVMWPQGQLLSAQRYITGVGVQQIPGECAGVFSVHVNAIGITVLHLQPYLISHVEVQDNLVAGGGRDGWFCSFDHRVEIAKQSDFKWLQSNRQAEGEDVCAVDGSCVDAPWVKVRLLVGKDAWERNG